MGHKLGTVRSCYKLFDNTYNLPVPLIETSFFCSSTLILESSTFLRSQELRELARKAWTRAAHIVACPPPHLLLRGSLASCRFLVAFSIPIIHEMRGMAVDANRSKSHLSLPGLCFCFFFFFFWGAGK